MKIVLLGANGRTGREILSLALSAGYTVTALVRAEDRLANVTHSKLNVHVGNVCDYSFLKEILPGSDAVISTLGPRTPTKTACAIYSESATSIVKAMGECGVNRLLVTSTALLFPSDKFLNRVLGFIARHNARSAGSMEETICSSNLEWTIVRLGFLNDKNSTDFRLEVEALPDGGGSVSRAAVANFLLTEAKQAKYARKIVGLSG